MKLRVLLAAMFALLGSCTGVVVNPQVEGEALMQLSRDWSELVASGDLDAVLAVWAEDAVLMPPGMPALEGKMAIRSYVEAAAQLPGFQISWEPVRVHVSRSGDMAYMIERNVSTVNDSLGHPVMTYGKVVTVWQKDSNGSWKNVIDIWNESPAPSD